MGLGLHDRTIGRLPRPWRTLADWLITIAVAIAVVLVVETEVAKPFRVPVVVDGADAEVREAGARAARRRTPTA